MCVGEHSVLDHAGQKREDVRLETGLVLSLNLEHSCDSCSDVQCWGWVGTHLNSCSFLFFLKRLGGERTDGDWLLQNCGTNPVRVWAPYTLHH